MRGNVGQVDQAIRAILGIVLVMVGIGPVGGMQGNVWGVVVALVGLALLLTASMHFCPVYRLLGISTNKKR